jgi:hypothetical protein
MIERFKGAITLEARMEISEFFSSPVLNNEVDAVEHDVKLKALEEAISDARGKIKSKVIEGASQIKTCLGVEVSTTNGGQTLNYADDQEWSMLNKKLKDREKLLKSAWEMRQSDPNSEFVVNSEEIPVVGIKSHTAASVRYKFK